MRNPPDSITSGNFVQCVCVNVLYLILKILYPDCIVSGNVIQCVCVISYIEDII